MFYAGSKRNITPGEAETIIRELPPFIARVGVFVDPDASFVRQSIVSRKSITMHNRTDLGYRIFD